MCVVIIFSYNYLIYMVYVIFIIFSRGKMMWRNFDWLFMSFTFKMCGKKYFVFDFEIFIVLFLNGCVKIKKLSIVSIFVFIYFFCKLL